jgi:hypothetical protein
LKKGFEDTHFCLDAEHEPGGDTRSAGAADVTALPDQSAGETAEPRVGSG